MPSESAAAPPPNLPPELREDYARFEETARAWLERDPSALGEIDPSTGARARFAQLREYGILLHQRAATLALIAKSDRERIFTRHILDSLNPIALFERPPASLLDIGSGAGLPGIPLAIVWPHTRALLLESRDKKAGFLEQAARALGLPNVQVICARLEDYGRAWDTPPAAAVFVRAVGDLPTLLTHAREAAEEAASWTYFLGERSLEQALGTPPHPDFPATIQSGSFGARLLTGRFPSLPTSS